MTAPAPSAEFALPSTEFTVAGVHLECAHFPVTAQVPSCALLCIPGYAARGESFARLRPLAGMADLQLLTLPEEAWRRDDPVGAFAVVVAEFAKRFDRPVIVGTSFGGLVALESVTRRADNVSGVVLISTFAMHPRGRMLSRGPWLLRLFEALVPFIEPLGVRLLAANRIDAVASFELRRETHSITRREKHARLMASLRADLREAARTIAVPALIIHGTADPLVPVTAARELSELIPSAELVMIEGAGHLPYITHADKVNAAMSRFCARLFATDDHAPPSSRTGPANRR